MSRSSESLEAIVRKELATQVPPEVAAIARAACAGHAPGVEAVIAYGSCLRGTSTTESLIDLYILTRDLSSVSSNPLSRLLCGLLPPNVYYAEARYDGRLYRAKYAVLPLSLFARKVRPATSNPYFWARFSQPCALVSASGEQARDEVVAAVCQAVRTMLGECRALAGTGDSALKLWERGLRATYATELRSEAGTRAREIVEANSPRYAQLAEIVLGETGTARSSQNGNLQARWRFRRISGKLHSVCRLLKAAFTFQGGADYLAWKISRHSGVAVELTPWQRRHPILAAIVLLPQLLRSGAVR